MLLQAWSLTLIVTWAVILLLVSLAVRTAIRVLRHWKVGSDTALQIGLEEETWLASALMQFALVFQIFSLVMLVLAADHFSGQLVGAMCATGAFTANGFGLPALMNKILLVFLCGYWLVLHRLDLGVETMPLVRHKFVSLLALLPPLTLDGLFLVGYLVDLSPDVITSCCGVLIRPGNADGYNLLDPFSLPLLLGLFYGLAILLTVGGLVLVNRKVGSERWLRFGHAILWALFFPVALWAITIYFSSYIYSMPFHRCPFDLLAAEFYGIGYPIYGTLFGATFWGTAGGIAEMVSGIEGMGGAVRRFQQQALCISLVLLPLFLLLTGYAPLRYFLLGGEG